MDGLHYPHHFKDYGRVSLNFAYHSDLWKEVSSRLKQYPLLVSYIASDDCYVPCRYIDKISVLLLYAILELCR